MYSWKMTVKGPVIFRALNGNGSLAAVFHRPDYTQAQAQQVVDWLNGKDQPIQLQNWR